MWYIGFKVRASNNQESNLAGSHQKEYSIWRVVGQNHPFLEAHKQENARKHQQQQSG